MQLKKKQNILAFAYSTLFLIAAIAIFISELQPLFSHRQINMGCGKIYVDEYACVGCSYKTLLLGVGLLCLLILVLGTLEEHDGHVMMRSAAVLAARRSMVVESMKLQVVFEDEEMKPSEEDTDHHMIQYRSPSTAEPGKEIVDINYMSKRRVPNGADPIHNRRAGKSRQPPNKT